VLVPKDKAVKRFIVRNIVDASAIRDIQDSSAIECASLK
jgi:small subunit ribosomal protein S26e